MLNHLHGERERVRRCAGERAAEAHRIQLEAAIAAKELQRAAENRQAEAEVRLLEARQRIANEATPGNLQARLIEALPLVAEKLPKPAELRAISIGGGGGGGAAGDAQSLASLVAQVAAILDGFRARAPLGGDPQR